MIMSESKKKITIEEASDTTSEIKVETQQSKGALVERYLRRRAEVTEADNRAFQDYLQEKALQQKTLQESTQPTACVEAPAAKSSWFNRRNLLKVVAGTAVAGETAAVGYAWVNGGPAGAPAGGLFTGPQREPIARQMTDSKADIGGRSLGKWILLLPTKLGGGTYAIDLNSNRVLGSIWYWTYGDYSPISHHLCAFPSSDPLHGFEFVNSTQGGQNSLIYGMPTQVTAETAPEGTNIYRVRYDGTQMQLVENVSETTGLGLGVHVTVNPKDAQSYFVTDGQKDIAACFDRTT